MKSASIVAEPECRDGKAPNTTGEAVKVEVYRSMLKSGRARHAVVCGRQAVQVLVPWRSTREAKLNADTDNVHPAKCASKCGSCAGRAENEHEARADERRTEVSDAIRQPSQNVEKCALVCGEDVAQIGAVEDVLKCREDADPDWRAVLARDELTCVEEDQPSCYREERQEKLAGQRNQQAENEQGRHECLCKRPRTLNDTEREDPEDGKKDVLRIPDAPLVLLQTSKGVCWVQRGL
jgi:hypothetical protein